jgi:molybdenum cofactor cytidylyltransferase
MVPAIVLAAGASTRMGRPKPLLPLGDGETFLTRILKTLRDADVDDMLVVVGHDGASIKASMIPLGFAVRVVENPEYTRGQLSSLQAGLRAADRPGVRAVLVTLVDLPLISSSTVRAVLEAYRRHPTAAMVRPVSGDRHGHPVVFDRQLFDELRAGDPAVGAKPIVNAHRDAILGVPVTDEGAFVDIDTPGDYERLIGKLPDESHL